MGIVVSSNSGPDDDVASPRAEPHAGVGDIVAASAGGVGTSRNDVEASTSSVTNGARVDNPALCQNLLDHITPPGYLVALHNQSNASFLDSFNINSAQHTCMLYELRLRYEHEIMTREKFQKKFTDNYVVVQQRDVEIAALKTRLEKAEGEAAEVVALRSRVSELEGGMAVKSEEVNTLSKQNTKLLSKVSAFESERGELNRHIIKLGGDCERLRNEVVGVAKLIEEFKSFQDAAERQFSERAGELDARIADVRRDMDNDLYPHMLTAIAGRRWVVGHGFRLAVHKCARSVECHSALGKVISLAINKGIQEGLEAEVVHGKAGRSFPQIEAYDPEIETKYVVAVSKFENVSFPLLDELEGFKDSPLALIMSALTLKDDHGDTNTTPEFLYCEEGVCPPLSFTLGGDSSFVPPHGSSLGVTNYQVSTLVLSGDGGSATQSPVVPAHDDLFDTSVLDGSGGV
ncbi:hypothetical protein Tco_0748167 [Tanacetum coccineum]|uniref:Transposase (Putative), gypsy type n=1 Tax=Tanacetum coccineum TaxID=301880 RepID=A0ABQ4YW06_9ASTR